MTSGDVWLPFPPDEIEGLPASLGYRRWNGEEEFPADPADCVFYAVPYMKGQRTALRPLERMSRLRVAQTLTAGWEHMVPGLDLMPTGSLLCNAGGLHDTSTAELALALILAAQRGIPEAVRSADRGDWEPALRPSLADRTVLILGYGGIGRAVEERLVPFEPAEVIRVATTARTSPRGAVHAVADLDGLLPRAEIVVVCTPLTDLTRGLVNGDFLARLPDDALVVNVARGAVVDTAALLAELGRGRLRAALDVTDPEPLPADHPLWRAPGVLISPHVGGASSAFRPRADRLLRSQLARFAAGERPEFVVAEV
ncbi:2-hydroxyacid dehydrogenase [Streptomyces calidiresistens]|uniref:Dihydrofolate reductase n=1 Tax=Streptomyces calidiresistens TaxID=1485586 RepID=A0A7W3T248_9ACTN|nr:2-hydroxyacid dehydrogenase [Streptomyces calidiresistens]MBB0229525.1 dihydrofolate reductase [Streptomyces calidiresistens]